MKVCVACVVPELRVADVTQNVERIVEILRSGKDFFDFSDAENWAKIAVFPELSLCGYTCQDLFLNELLLQKCREGLETIRKASVDIPCVILVGAPLVADNGFLYNCAIAIQKGKYLVITPKTFLPNYREFQEVRWFRSAKDVPRGATITLFADDEPIAVPFGTDCLLQHKKIADLRVFTEVCEDVFVPVQPSSYAVCNGATVVCNLSASNFIMGKAEIRRNFVQTSSKKGICAYVYVAAGPGESSTDAAFDADAFVSIDGKIQCESKRFCMEGQHISAEVDVAALAKTRAESCVFTASAEMYKQETEVLPDNGTDYITLRMKM